MLLDLSGYAAPTSLVAAAGLKQNVLSWDDYPDRDHVKFAVYRYPTLTDANNDTNRIFLGFTRNSEFKDAANHTAGTTQWYRVSSIDRDDNESAKSAVGSVVHKRVGSGDLDNGAVIDVNMGAGRGSNLLINTNANLGTAYWRELADPNNVTTFLSREINYAWAPKGERVFVLEQLDGTTGSYTDVVQADEQGNDRKIPVKANQRYEFHLLTGAHRCTGRAYIMWFDASDNNLSNLFTNDNASEASGGQLLTGYKQIGIFGVAPATAAYAKIVTRKMNTNVGAAPATSYLFYTHLFFGEAGPNQTEFSPWAENGNLITTEATTDQTPPATPSVSLAGYGADFDLDGTIDAGIAATITNPNTGVKIVGYILDIQRSDNDGPGTYSDWKREPVPAEDVADALATIFRFQANRRKYYRARVRAVAFAGRKGPWSAFSAPAQPSTYTGYNGATPAAPGISRIANGYVVTAAVGALNAALFKEMEILVGGVTLIKVPGLTYQDMTARAIGATPTYTVKLYDKAGGVTNVSPGTVAAAFRANTTAEIGAGAVLGSNMGVGVGGNQIKNSDFRAGISSNWRAEYSSNYAKFTVALRTDTYAPDPGAYEIRQIDSTMDTVGGVNWEYGVAPALPDGSFEYYAVEANKWYEFSVYYLGHRCAGMQPYIKWETGAGAHISYSSAGIFLADHGTNPLKNLGNYQRTPFFKAQAPANAGRALIFFRHKGTRQGFSYADSFLWFTKPYFNECSPNQSEHTPWSDGALSLVGTGNTDQTAPATPSIPLMTGVTADIDRDGTVDTGFSMNLPAPSTGVPVKFWEVEVWQADAQGASSSMTGYTKRGSSIFVKAEAAGNTYVEFKGKSTKWYKTRYRGHSFSVKEGGWSGFQALGAQPGAYNSISSTTPAAPTVMQIANGYRVSFPVPADKTYRETEILVGGVALTRTASGVFVDTTSRNVGDTPSYTIRHYDRSLAASNVSTATVAPAYRATTQDELGDYTVKASKYADNPGGNLIRDYEMEDIKQWFFGDWGFGGHASPVPLPPANTVRSVNPSVDLRGASKYKWRITATGAGRGTTMQSDYIAVRPGRRYRFSAIVDLLGSGLPSGGLYIYARYFSRDASGNLVAIAGLAGYDYFGTGAALPAGKNTIDGYAVMADNVAYVKIAVQTEYGGAVAADYYVSGMAVEQVPNAQDINEIYSVRPGPVSFGAFATIAASIDIPDVGSNALFEADQAVIYARWHSNTGSNRTWGYEIDYAHGGGLVIPIASVTNLWMPDDAIAQVVTKHNGLPREGTLRLKLIGTAAGNSANGIELIADLRQTGQP